MPRRLAGNCTYVPDCCTLFNDVYRLVCVCVWERVEGQVERISEKIYTYNKFMPVWQSNIQKLMVLFYYFVDYRMPRSGNGPPHSPGRLAAQDTHRTVAFVELLKHTNEPLGLALEGALSRAHDDVLFFS